LGDEKAPLARGEVWGAKPMNRPRYFGFVNSLGLSHMGIVLVLLIVGKAFFRTLQLLAAYSSGQFTFLKESSPLPD
jgi:hypothetical protein